MRPCPAVQTTSPGHRQHTSPTSQTIGFTEHVCVGITAAAITVLTNSVSWGATALCRIEFGWGCRDHWFKFAHLYDRYLWYLYFRPVT